MKSTMVISTSGLSLPVFLSITFLIVVSLSIESNAKRGCAAFGHSCFGGHGKRSDPNIDADNDISGPGGKIEDNVNRDIHDYDAFESARDLQLGNPIKKFKGREQERRLLSRFSRISPQRLDSDSSLSLLMNQWLTSYRRPQRAEFGIKTK